MAPAGGVGGDSTPPAKDEQRSDPREIGFRGSRLEFIGSMSAGLRRSQRYIVKILGLAAPCMFLNCPLLFPLLP